MQAETHLSASLEDYLEAILAIVEQKRAARVKDIVASLKVKPSSVSAALRLLTDRGLINYAPHDIITLTDAGEAIARGIALRHEKLRYFLEHILCVDPVEADAGACGLEHAVSAQVLERLIRFVQFVEQCPRTGQQWIEEFRRFCERGSFRNDCEACITQCLEIHKKTSAGR